MEAAMLKAAAHMGTLGAWEEPREFEELYAHSSCLASFTLRWKELQSHLSSVKLSIEERLRELETEEKALLDATSTTAAVSPAAASSMATPQSPEKDKQPFTAAEEREPPAAVSSTALSVAPLHLLEKDKSALTAAEEESPACATVTATAVLSAAASSSTTRHSAKDKQTLAAAEGEPPEVEPRPELKNLCISMDGKGLLAFINDHRPLRDIYRELIPAIRAAPDPAALILVAMDAMEWFDKKHLHYKMYALIVLLERLHMLSPEIKPAVRDRARKLAAEWKAKTKLGSGKYNDRTLALLHLMVSYGIASDFRTDELFGLLVSVARNQKAIYVCRNLGLHERVADLIQKLSSEGKQLDAIKFVYAFDLVEKFPPARLLKAYRRESKKAAQETRRSGKGNSLIAAIVTELDQIRAVIKAIQLYKLESEYPPERLQKRAAKLEQEKAVENHHAASAAVMNPDAHAQPQQANKRPRPSPVAGQANAMVAAHLQPPPSQPQPQLQFPFGAPYMASTGPYDPTGSINPSDRAAAVHHANPPDLGAMQCPPGPLLDPHPGPGMYAWQGWHPSFGT